MSCGKRIKFQKQGHLMVSYNIYAGESGCARLVIDTETKRYKVVDPTTNFVHSEGGEGINNMEVLQRHAKRALEEFLNARFEREVRKLNE